MFLLFSFSIFKLLADVETIHIVEGHVVTITAKNEETTVVDEACMSVPRRWSSFLHFAVRVSIDPQPFRAVVCVRLSSVKGAAMLHQLGVGHLSSASITHKFVQLSHCFHLLERNTLK